MSARYARSDDTVQIGHTGPVDWADMADRKHGTPAPATTSTVRDEDWPGRDLSGEKYDKVAFFDVDMMESTNDGAVPS